MYLSVGVGDMYGVSADANANVTHSVICNLTLRCDFEQFYMMCSQMTEKGLANGPRVEG